MKKLHKSTIIAYVILLIILLFSLFLYRSISREFYFSYFTYIISVFALVTTTTCFLYRSINSTATSEQKRSFGYFFKHGILTALIGVSISVACISLYSRNIDDYYARRMDWEEQEYNRYSSLPLNVKADLMQQQQDYNEMGLEEWIIIVSGGLAAIAASAGLVSFFLDHSKKQIVA